VHRCALSSTSSSVKVLYESRTKYARRITLGVLVRRTFFAICSSGAADLPICSSVILLSIARPRLVVTAALSRYVLHPCSPIAAARSWCCWARWLGVSDREIAGVLHLSREMAFGRRVSIHISYRWT